MARYSEALAKKIVSLVEVGNSVSEICGILEISRQTFYTWKTTKPEFETMLAEAVDNRDEMLMAKAHKSLLKKIEGYSLTETKATYVPDDENPNELKMKTYEVKTKEYAPDNASLKLILTRNDRLPKDENKPPKPTLNITVRDPEAAVVVNNLYERLRNEK